MTASGTMDNWQSEVKRHWGWEINDERIYERICDGYPREDFDRYDSSMVWELNPGPEDICLNVGCGLGRVEKFLACKVREVHSVDFSETMIDRARERLKDCPNVFFYRNDGESLTMFGENAFDIAWSELVFQHIPKEIIRKYVREIHRVLKPGGRFISLIPRFERYGDTLYCGGMTFSEVMEMLSPFSSVVYSDIENEWYISPIAQK